MAAKQEEEITGWGGPRPNSGRKRGPRRYPKLDTETAKSLYALTRYRRALFGNAALTEEEVIKSLVEAEWEQINMSLETKDAEEMQEPYIL